jgi:hypothetical protein
MVFGKNIRTSAGGHCRRPVRTFQACPAYTRVMDVLISVVIGIAALIVLGALVLNALGIGANQIDPVSGLGGIWLSRRINAARRKRSLKRLPSSVPPPPPTP